MYLYLLFNIKPGCSQ